MGKGESGRLVISYSEVTWYEITVDAAEVAEAIGGELPADLDDLTGTEDTDRVPEGLWELIGSMIREEARGVTRTETDGGEIGHVKREESL